MDERPITCSHENQLLLDAIRNKFATQTGSDEGSFSPPKLNIPLLKATSANSTNRPVLPLQELEKDGQSAASHSSASNSSQTPPNLNQFICSQLEEKFTLPKSGFFIPRLSRVSNSTISTTESEITDFSSRLLLPILNTDKTGISGDNHEIAAVSCLSKHLQELTFTGKDLASKTTIDLTEALSNNNSLYDVSPSNRVVTKAPIVVQDFDIPFIACDLKDDVTLQPAIHEYCQPDISNLKFRHCLMAPSSFARITCIKFKRIRKLPFIDHSFKSKHNIEQFLFNSNSPDDTILANLKKFRR